MTRSEIFVSPDAAIRGDAPHWDGAGKVHDWRNHVPYSVRKIWTTFTLEQRTAIVEWAEDLAQREDWE